MFLTRGGLSECKTTHFAAFPFARGSAIRSPLFPAAAPAVESIGVSNIRVKRLVAVFSSGSVLVRKENAVPRLWIDFLSPMPSFISISKKVSDGVWEGTAFLF